MRSRRHKKPLEPHPPMMRGESEFEEAKIRCDFQAVFTQISNAYWNDMKSPIEFCYRQAYFAGKAAGKRESLGSPTTETEMSPIDASVRETAGAQKEKENGTTTSD